MLTDWSVNTPPSSPPQEGFSGLIERVTFHSEETGFAVLRVKVKGHRQLVTVVGALASVNAGEWITAQGNWVQGNWVQDKEHRLQFKATFLKCSPPTSREGIEKYLASGLIKGIGPVYAKKLVEKFGEEIFTVIDHYSVKLEEVDEIGPGFTRSCGQSGVPLRADISFGVIHDRAKRPALARRSEVMNNSAAGENIASGQRVRSHRNRWVEFDKYCRVLFRVLNGVTPLS